MDSRVRSDIKAVLSKRLLELGLAEDLIDGIEAGIFDTAFDAANRFHVIKSWKNPRFVRLYYNRAYGVVSNMALEGSRLKQRVVDRELAAESLAAMSPHEMFPENWKEIMDLKVRHNEHILEERPAAMTDSFKCGKCKKRECIYQELQLRSADEPMTLFITCLNCGNRWKI